MKDLVKKLSIGKHNVKLDPRTKDMMLIKKRIEDGFILLKFNETNGGTELGIHINKSQMNLDEVSFLAQAGILKIVGVCTLDGFKVRCLAEIDLATREGSGWLENY